MEKIVYLLAIDCIMLARVGAVEKLAVEKLNADNSENELEQYVHDENVYNIF